MNNSRHKILIVDDERLNLEVLTRILTPDTVTGVEGAFDDEYTLIAAKSGEAALRLAEKEMPDLILLDIVMPGKSGFEVLSELKASSVTSAIPVIFITGLNSVEDEETGFRLGAVDYITKPFHSSIVKARVKTHLQIVEQMRTIEQLGLIDMLTNIPNRRGFEARMDAEWRLAVREGKPLGMLMADIDGFKEFNDTYGHQQGDIVLKALAKILTLSVRRPSDTAARWGGEEFAVILPNTELDGAVNVAEGIRERVERTFIAAKAGGLPLKVTISIGAASIVPDHNSSVTEFIDRADQSLYAAKRAGKNRVCAYESVPV